MSEHLPECAVPWIRECICSELKLAYDRAIKEMKPECTCGHDDLEYIFHLQDCKQGAFLMSQDKTEWMDPDEI